MSPSSLRSSHFALLAFVLLALAASAQQSPPPATQSPQRDPQAVAIAQHAVAAMASAAPADSSANGTVTIVEGSMTQTGTIQILTRGTGQTAETLTLPEGQRVTIYSNGDAKEIKGTQTTKPSLELIVSDQCPDFPLPFLSSVLSNADEDFVYVGQETLNGTAVQHIRVWSSFSSQPDLQELAPFSQKDIWFDASSGLPTKLVYSRRSGRGAVPAIPVEISFSNWTNVGGVLYPFQINKSYNGTPWQTITITKVSFNTGLTDTNFPAAQGGAL